LQLPPADQQPHSLQPLPFPSADAEAEKLSIKTRGKNLKKVFSQLMVSSGFAHRTWERLER
jgi:hypothetical protein